MAISQVMGVNYTQSFRDLITMVNSEYQPALLWTWLLDSAGCRQRHHHHRHQERWRSWNCQQSKCIQLNELSKVTINTALALEAAHSDGNVMHFDFVLTHFILHLHLNSHFAYKKVIANFLPLMLSIQWTEMCHQTGQLPTLNEFVLNFRQTAAIWNDSNNE